MIRILTGLFLAVAVTAATFLAPPIIFKFLVAGLVCIALREYFAIARSSGIEPLEKFGYLAALLWILVPIDNYSYFLTLVVLVLMLVGMLFGRPHEQILPASAATLTGVLYITGPMFFGLLLHKQSAHWLIFVILISAAGDGAAYYVGKNLGRHALAPYLSPNKTWEGAIGSCLFGTLAGVLYLEYFLPGSIERFELILLASTVNICAQCGDIAESALKRGAGLKDSGRMLPGHGGILDRIDGVLFSMPVAYGYLSYIHS